MPVSIVAAAPKAAVIDLVDAAPASKEIRDVKSGCKLVSALSLAAAASSTEASLISVEKAGDYFLSRYRYLSS